MLFQTIANQSPRLFGQRIRSVQDELGAGFRHAEVTPGLMRAKARPGAEDLTMLAHPAHTMRAAVDERTPLPSLRPIAGWDAASVRVALAQKRTDAIACIQQRIAREKSLLLQDGTHTQLMLQPTPTGKGTAVLLHGWSAGTWQYEELAPELLRQGYDVYIPRLPGHGFKNAKGVEDPRFLPKSGEFDAYRRFADEIFEDVRHLGGPIKLVGLSGGGAVALDIATRHPEVKAVVAMAPFMGIPNLEKFAPLVDLIDRLWFGLGRSVLDQIPYGWGKDAVRTPSFHEFKLGNITAARRYGMKVGRNLPKSQVPTQLITTAIDQSASNALNARWFRKGMPRQSGWYEFPASAKVPHPMIGKPNNPDDALRAQIRQMITHYLETTEPRQRLPE